MSQSKLEEELYCQMRIAGLPRPEREFRFHPSRRFRFDFAWPDMKLAVEIHGGEWIQGRHHRAPGFLKDCEKMNEATILRWRVLVFGGTHVKKGVALDVIMRALNEFVDIKKEQLTLL